MTAETSLEGRTCANVGSVAVSSDWSTGGVISICSCGIVKSV